MPIDYSQNVLDQINEFIGGREQVVIICDFDILNIGWSATAVLTENRISFFTFSGQYRTSDLTLQDYAEIGLSEVTSVEVEELKDKVKIVLGVGKGLFVLESTYKEDAARFGKLIEKNRAMAAPFKGWQDLSQKFSQGLSSWFTYIITQTHKANPGSAKYGWYGCGGSILLLLLAAAFSATGLGVVGLIVGIAVYYIFFRRKKQCPNCGAVLGLRLVDRGQIEGSPGAYNSYYHCTNCNFMHIIREDKVED